MDINATPQIRIPPPQSHGDDLITGRFGLRAGWGIAIFIVLHLIFLALFSTAAPVARQIIARHQTPSSSNAASGLAPDDTLIREALNLAGVALTALILSRIERRRIAVYGIGRSRIGDLLPGAFWGLATLSLLVGILRATHVLVFDARALSGSAIFFYAAAWLLVFLVVGIFEEYLSRGYLQYTLTRGLLGIAELISEAHARLIAFWIAATIMSIVFGIGHIFNPGESTPGIIAVFLAGIIFSYTLWRTGSLWWAIGFHMAWDWAESFLYGVPDSGNISAGRLFNTHPLGNPLLSGGTAGPEGSIFVIPTFLLVLLIVRSTTRPGIQPTFETLHTPPSLPPDSTSLIA